MRDNTVDAFLIDFFARKYQAEIEQLENYFSDTSAGIFYISGVYASGKSLLAEIAMRNAGRSYGFNNQNIVHVGNFWKNVLEFVELKEHDLRRNCIADPNNDDIYEERRKWTGYKTSLKNYLRTKSQDNEAVWKDYRETLLDCLLSIHKVIGNGIIWWITVSNDTDDLHQVYRELMHTSEIDTDIPIILEYWESVSPKPKWDIHDYEQLSPIASLDFRQKVKKLNFGLSTTNVEQDTNETNVRVCQNGWNRSPANLLDDPEFVSLLFPSDCLLDVTGVRFLQGIMQNYMGNHWGLNQIVFEATSYHIKKGNTNVSFLVNYLNNCQENMAVSLLEAMVEEYLQFQEVDIAYGSAIHFFDKLNRSVPQGIKSNSVRLYDYGLAIKHTEDEIKIAEWFQKMILPLNRFSPWQRDVFDQALKIKNKLTLSYQQCERIFGGYVATLIFNPMRVPNYQDDERQNILPKVHEFVLNCVISGAFNNNEECKDVKDCWKFIKHPSETDLDETDCTWQSLMNRIATDKSIYIPKLLRWLADNKPDAFR